MVEIMESPTAPSEEEVNSQLFEADNASASDSPSSEIMTPILLITEPPPLPPMQSKQLLTTHLIPPLPRESVLNFPTPSRLIPGGLKPSTPAAEKFPPIKPETFPAPRLDTPTSAISSSRSLGDMAFSSQSFVFHDLHELGQKIESNHIYAAIDYAFQAKDLTYTQATELRNKVAVLVDMYGQRFRMQKSMQETVMNQVRYYQEHYEELYKAETLPWRMRQKLSGLRGDTQRLNDELTKSKNHLMHLEAEIVKLESDKVHYHETLEAIPTAHEFRHLTTCLHLEQQVILQQLENYGALIGKTMDHIQDNDAVIANMEKRTESIRSEMNFRRRDLANLTASIPHIVKECSQHAIELSKLGEEFHQLNSTNHRTYQHAMNVSKSVNDLEKELHDTYHNRANMDHQMEQNLQHFKESIRKLDKAIDINAQAKHEKAVLAHALHAAENSYRMQAFHRLNNFRKRDHGSTAKQNLAKDNKRTAQANGNDREALNRLSKKVGEEEAEADGRHYHLLRVEHLIRAYSQETQEKKEGYSRLYRQKRERYKDLFMRFMQIRNMVKEARKTKETIAHMELVQRSTNIACDKLKKVVLSMREDIEHKDLVLRFDASTLVEKLQKVEVMQREYYKMDRERQEMQEAYRVCQGGLHEHKERVVYLDDEFKRVKDEAEAVQRILDRVQHERRDSWISLQLVRKSHYAEREKLHGLEDSFEREFSRVLVLRRDLDINLLKCETFTETFELVSELRACEAALLIDITTQYMLKHVDKNQIETATYRTELGHRLLDSYVEWLYRTADTDIKLLCKRLRWHGALMLKYSTTRDELKEQLVEAINHRTALNKKVLECNNKTLKEVMPALSLEELRTKEGSLSKMLIGMEKRYFQQSIRHTLLDRICQAAIKHVETHRGRLTMDHETVMLKRDKVMRAKRQHKLALIDVVAAKTQLCNELILADNLQTVKELTSEKYQLPQLQAGDRLLPITDGSELKTR